MPMPGVSCKTVAMQNSSQWSCSMCPIPQFRLVGVRTSCIFLVFSRPHYKSLSRGPPGCTLLQPPLSDIHPLCNHMKDNG